MRKQDLMNNAEFINKAKYIVAKYTNENILKPEQGLISENEVFVAWYAKVLQNHKALLATLIEGDQHYYEVTYNGDKKQLYLDVYNKQENKCFEVEN
ncbi:DUF6275 family protein [Limosilactobacillus reuteri]|uniref:DUF6275 family protein n=2 Tax=Limosilactobacillus reuteri TaxID=1598 RepID=UPI001E5350E9|nr:DUF6275 family protein [Limosilactobacillus reuteri]MCC4349213.1 DUF6275 family protein [Limosilactobacillus reuteri]MCC4385269.1 DUF6275 family protein [Limosilactobacillus reuteri]